MAAEKGVSLMELLIVLALASTLSLTLLFMTRTVQTWSSQLTALVQRDEDAELAPLIFLRDVSHAGNNRTRFPGPPVESTPDGLWLRSDFDGRGRLPDGLLDHPFESVQYRCRNEQLQIRSGNGTFQSILKNTKEASWSWSGSTSLEIQLTSSMPPAAFPGQGVKEWHIRFYLWNLRDNLFGSGP